MTSERIYKVLFNNQGNVYEVYTKSFAQSATFGFIEVEGLIFGEKSSLVVDPSEEKLKTEFEGVHRIFIPLHSVIRIDEVEKEGKNKIHPGGDSNVATFPTIVPPSPPGKK